MKNHITHVLILISYGFLASVCAAQSKEYDELSKAMALVIAKNINGTDYVAFYIKSKRKVNFDHAGFRLDDDDGGVLNLKYTILNDMPMEERNHEDIDYIGKGFQIKLWVPKDPVKYKGWTMRHDLGKGACEIALSRIFTNKPIDEKRKERAKEAEPVQ